MAQSVTVDKILDAAEILFAEKGFSETSLRMITSNAGVNLAAVNYHFGSKNALIQAIFSRFLGPLTTLMEQGMAEKGWSQKDENAPLLEDILKLYTRSLLKIPTSHPNGVSVFMRLMGLAYTQSQGHLRRYLEDEYSRIFRLLMHFVKQSTPNLSTAERFWRIQFTMGSVAFTMSSIQPLTEILEDSKKAQANPEQVVNFLVPYLLAGLTSEPVDAVVIN
jgi:AcrR family transcriptional regulator